MALSDNLISAWELDEASGTRVDSHGAEDLTDNNTVLSGTGNVNATAADFVGTNSEYLSRASNANLQTGDIGFTFELWFKADNIAVSDVLLGKDVNTPANSRDYTIDLSGSKTRFYVNGGGAAPEAVWSSALSSATWYQVICWHDPDANVVAITINDGTPVTDATGGTVPQTSNAEFRIGARAYASFEGYFDGLIGPVRFWKRVLTGAERTELYNAGAGRTYAYIAGAGADPEAGLIGGKLVRGGLLMRGALVG